MNKCIVASGSLAGGHEFYGPFDNPRKALDWADIYCRPHTFTVAPLEEPDGETAEGEDWSDKPGQFVLLIGDGYNGYSIVGTFDCPESAIDYEEHYEADSDGYHTMWVKVSKPD